MIKYLICIVIAKSLVLNPILTLFVIVILIYLKHLNHKHLKFILILIIWIILYSYAIKHDVSDSSGSVNVLIAQDLKVTDYNTSTIARNGFFKTEYVYDTPLNDLKYGDIYTCSITSSEPVVNKYNNPSSFDYQSYMYQKKVTSITTVNSCSYSGHRYTPKSIMLNIRQILITRNNINYPDISNYMNALLFAERDFDTELTSAFSNLSIIHLFTISGAHILLISSTIALVFSFLSITKRKKQILTSIILILYASLCAFTIPIMRAVLTQAIYLISNERISKKDATFYVFIFYIVINPLLLFNTSFILTYLIAFIIIFCKDKKLIPLYIYSFTFPIIININYQFNIFSYLFNSIVSPIVMTILLPLSFILTVSDVPPLSTTYYYLVIILERSSLFINQFSMIVGHIPFYQIIIYYTLLLCLIFKYYLYITKKIFITLLFIIFLNVNIIGSISFIDIGQGKAVLIQLPLNKGNILIDAGPSVSEGELESFIHYKGVTTLDIVFISHLHEDHYGGLPNLANTVTINTLYTSENTYTDSSLFLNKGDTVKFNGFNFKVLSPPTGEIEPNPNNQSLVIYTELGGKTWLFPGDIEEPIEQDLINTYPGTKINYLDVAHHGSSTSTSEDFIDQIDPDQAIIQVGCNNMYNHPSDQTINTLEENNIPVYDTCSSGLIEYKFIGEHIF